MSDWSVVDITRYAPDDTPSASYAASVPAPVSTNTKGVWTTIISALPYDVAGIVLKIEYPSGADHVFDIGIGASPNEVVVVPDVLCGATIGVGPGSFFNMGILFIPIALFKGTRVAMRMQSTTNGVSIRAKMQFVGATYAGFQGFNRAATVGVSTSGTTAGTLVTTGAGNAKGSWAELSPGGIAFTARHILWVGFGNTGTAADWGMDLGIGPAGSEIAILPDMFYRTRNTGYTECWSLSIVIPKGTRIACRGNSSSDALPFRTGLVLLG